MILDGSKRHEYLKALLDQCKKPRNGLKRFFMASGGVCFLFAAWLAFSFSGIGTVSDAVEGAPLSAYDCSAVPQSVIDDAARLAKELYGDSRGQYEKFVNQLVATYAQAHDKDFLILFSPGGWGGSLAENSADWWSILTGIESELGESGYTSLALNYQRTINTLQGRLNELKEMATGYSAKATELAYRVKFLTSNNPDLKVILAGESTGTVICDDAMDLLKENSRVFSIQTGSPFWHRSERLVRTLQINSNGIVPDSFSEGKIGTMLFATLKSWVSPAPKGEGTILNFLTAPGHEYWWQNQIVYTQIENFLKKNFGIKSS